MKAIPVLATLLAALACGCTTTATHDYRASEELRICETVLLESLAQQDSNRVIFVAFRSPDGEMTDPSEAFLSRLRAAGIRARKASESATNEHTAVIDRASGKPGVIHYAGVLRWRGNSKVEAIKGLRLNSLGGGHTVIVLEKKDGRWRTTTIKKMVTI